MSDFGLRLQELRKLKGLSQTVASSAIGVSYSQYGRYELKGAKPPANVLQKMAEYFDTTVDFLLYGTTDEKASNSLKDTELLNHFKEVEKMPIDEKNTVIRFLGAFVRDFKTKQAYAS